MCAPPMGREGSRGYRVGQAEAPHTGMHTHAYGCRETMGGPPFLTGLNARHRGIGYTRGEPPTMIEWMEVNNILHTLCPLFFLSLPPWVCHV